MDAGSIFFLLFDVSASLSLVVLQFGCRTEWSTTEGRSTTWVGGREKLRAAGEKDPTGRDKNRLYEGRSSEWEKGTAMIAEEKARCSK